MSALKKSCKNIEAIAVLKNRERLKYTNSFPGFTCMINYWFDNSNFFKLLYNVWELSNQPDLYLIIKCYMSIVL